MFFPLCLDLNIAVRLQINRRTKQRTCMTPSMYLIRLDTKARMEEQNTRATLQERNALSQCHLEPASAVHQLAFRKQMQANRNRCIHYTVLKTKNICLMKALVSGMNNSSDCLMSHDISRSSSSVGAHS